MDRNAAPEGSRWFERSEHHWRSQRPSKSPPPAGAHLDLRSLRDHRAFGSVFRRCAAARRPPATILHPFGILFTEHNRTSSPRTAKRPQTVAGGLSVANTTGNPTPIRSPPQMGSHLDLRSLRDHRAFGSAFRRCAAARRPPATILHPFGIVAPDASEPTFQQPHQQPTDREAALDGSRWFERSEHRRKCQRPSNHRPQRGRTSICDPSGITARLGRSIPEVRRCATTSGYHLASLRDRRTGHNRTNVPTAHGPRSGPRR